MKSFSRWLLRLSIVLCSLLLLAALGSYWWLRGSLAQLDGTLEVTGLGSPVQLMRDAQGILTIDADTRLDTAFGLGFAHAQDRFFQMDLQRRNAAGELAALVGPAALPLDRQHRIHRFRARAERNYAEADERSRALLHAYGAGVNAGLEGLSKAPFEYALLGSEPTPWRAEDAYLTIFAMILILQDDQARFERGMGLMEEVFPADLFAFFSQQGGRWDAPLEGPAFNELPVPVSGYADLLADQDQALRYPALQADLLPGSNNWAVSGALTAHGSALVADDMHLGIRVPNIWYRASWSSGPHGKQLSGLTLPGLPLLVAGSNGLVAWGFTNTQGDWSDVIQLELNDDRSQYRTTEGWFPLTVHEETLHIHEGTPEPLRVEETQWGPIIGEDHQGRTLALRWAAHDPEGANFNAWFMEEADSVFDVLPEAHRFGLPHQNLVMGDHHGNIAWIIAGPVPRRVNLAGTQPTAWHTSDGGHWAGYHDADQQPRVVNPPSGRLWTANARVVSGEKLALMGMNGPALGARQKQIRDRLMALDQATEQDMLAIQLDDEALFLAPWRARLLDLLDAELRDQNDAFFEAHAALLNWSGRADRDDVGYRIVRQWRLAVMDRITAPLETALRAVDEDFRLRHVGRQLETPVWTLLEAQPAHLLNPEFSSWRALQVDALSDVLTPWYEDGTLANDPWGARNILAVSHPLAGALPLLGNWLSMPAEPVDGDTHMPRVQSPSFGASERFAVSPGREATAYLHMATGQSGHPLSPFFDAGHQDWVQGKASPWLAGATEHRLELRPAPP